MWVEESGGERINEVRAAEALATGAEIVAVACPFCAQMFEVGLEALPAAEKRMQVLDVAELLEKKVAYGKPTARAALLDIPAEEHAPG